MPKKKTILEKAEDVVETVSEKISEGIEKAEEPIAEAVEKITEKPKKAAKEKTPAKKTKLEELKAKAKKLAKSIETTKIKPSEKDEEGKETLAPIEDYLKSSIHLGTRAITPDMRPFVYKRRADSLAVFNTELLDEKIKQAGEYLSKYAPEDIIVVCKREAGAKAVELFSETTGIKAFIKK